MSMEAGADAAVTETVRWAWKKFRELEPFLGKVYIIRRRNCLPYGCDAWAIRAELDSKRGRTEMRMVRWMCGVSPKERQSSTELRRHLHYV